MRKVTLQGVTITLIPSNDGQDRKPASEIAATLVQYGPGKLVWVGEPGQIETWEIESVEIGPSIVDEYDPEPAVQPA
jgi:hypothetical protein